MLVANTWTARSTEAARRAVALLRDSEDNLVFVFALGSYLLPQILGRPQHWTLSVLITDQAIYQSNMPFAAAMAVFLVLISLALVGMMLLVGRRENAL